MPGHVSNSGDSCYFEYFRSRKMYVYIRIFCTEGLEIFALHD